MAYDNWAELRAEKIIKIVKAAPTEVIANMQVSEDLRDIVQTAVRGSKQQHIKAAREQVDAENEKAKQEASEAAVAMSKEPPKEEAPNPLTPAKV